MVYWDLDGFRNRVLRHKVRWDDSIFLLCRTVTPSSVRELRLYCNCPECYDSRRRVDRYVLSHPLGSFVDPPCSKHDFSQELREADYKTCFSHRDARIILEMMQTDPSVPFSHSSSPLYWPDSFVRRHTDYLISQFYPHCGVSLLGTQFERLRVFRQNKGPQMIKRALRSHSLSPFGRATSYGFHLYPIRESNSDIVSSGGKRYKYNTRYDDKFRICFRNIPGTIEYLILHECFYRGHNKLVFSGLDASEMSGPPVKRLRQTSKTSSKSSSLVNYYVIMTSYLSRSVTNNLLLVHYPFLARS